MNFSLLKTVGICVLIFCARSPGCGQDKGKGEWNAAVGLYAVEDVATAAFQAFLDNLFGTHDEQHVSKPVVFVTYKYHISERFALGGTTGFNGNSKSWDHYNRDGWRQRTMTSAMEGTLYWAKRPGFDFYSTAGAGFYLRERSYYETQKDTDAGPTMYLAPVGLRFGKDVGCFMEVGYGYKGIFNAGLSLRF
ncbi:hypothetical protein SAMN04487996_13351 [Dyadobacter soli]|uniref:Outer membrane protein beta-barrel domain-containing protein n=1 Tax=Dyadobacter soli TaxID=659014 RepID=A0A1G8BJD0_9BACT|nr:hypothetical protein [Dyadobacter soli]SDH33345.1 hypothetical protein SAMN04487996_13351 [Dyadobacter soli]